MILSTVLLAIVAFCLAQGSDDYLDNAWYQIYEVCTGGESCMKEIDWDPMGTGENVFAQAISRYDTTSWFVHHKGGGKYSFSTSCTLDCNTWNAKDHIIAGTKVSYNNGVKTLFKLEKDGTMSFKGDTEYRYKIVITSPEDLAGDVVDVRADGKLGYGNGAVQTRFIIKRNYSIVSGCNCSW